MAIQPTALRHRSVMARTGMTLIADTTDIAVEADFHFSSRDPFAVRVMFSVASAPAVEWVFSRELLVFGLNAPAGTGDVQVYPVRHGVIFQLSSPSGCARLVVDPQVLSAFVRDTLDLVPLGAEGKYFDLDQEIAMLAETRLPGASQS